MWERKTRLMKMTHRNCGGIVRESDTIPPYKSEEYGTVPSYQCIDCEVEILGDGMIEFIPENESDKIQIEAFTNI